MPDVPLPRTAGALTSHGLAMRLSPGLRRALAVGGAVAALSFVLHAALAQVFDRLGLYFLNDVLFASDTHDFLASIAHGAPSIRTLMPDLLNSIHPYVWFYFSPVVRGLAKLAATLHLSEASVFDLRLAIGILVVPLITAAQSIALAVLLHMLGLPALGVAALTLLNALTFSSLLYGSVPDHFMVTNLAITLIAIVSRVAWRNKDFASFSVWVPLGLFATGITSTNIAFVGIAYFYTQVFACGRGLWRTALRSAGFSAAILAFVLASADVAGLVTQGAPNTDLMRHDFIGRYMQVQATLPDRAARAATAIGNSLAPLASDVGMMAPPRTPDEHYPITRPAWQDFAPYPKFTFESGHGSVAGNPLALIGIAGAVLGTALMLAKAGPCRQMGAIALSFVAFNLVLHSLWGDEYVLYSQHWMTALIILLAGVFLAPVRWHTGIAGALLMYAAAMGLNNAVVFADLIGRMSAIAASTGWPH